MSERNPDVTVVVGAYNAMPYLTRCITSVTAQSLGADRVEIVAVDDGSTDATGPELERLADAYPGSMTVIHQENSGGPAAPRNAGLDRARGRYVFFLDADDHLGDEALERMVAAGDDNASDVVLGRMVGVGGRTAPARMFRRNQPRTTVFDSRVYWTLNPLKLFRRELIERLGLRFRTDLTIGEDQPFTATAYLHAQAISVVADYDCVYWVAREDGANITSVVQDTESRLAFLTAMTELVCEHTEPGAGRDLLLSRHLSIDLRETLRHLAREPDRGLRQKHLRTLQDVLAFSYGEGVKARLAAGDRLRCHLVEEGELDALVSVVEDEIARGTTSYGIAIPASGMARPLTTVVEDGRVYARYPHFRDPELPLPDDLYDVTDELKARHRLDTCAAHGGRITLTGHACLTPLGTRQPCTEVVLRERGEEREFRVPVEATRTPGLGSGTEGDDGDHSRAGFVATIDPATAAEGDRLPDGLWDVSLDVGSEGVTRRIRLGARRLPGVASAPVTQVLRDPAGDSVFAATSYFTVQGNLTLDIGERKHRLLPLLAAGQVGWSAERGTALVVDGRCEVADLPAGALVLRAVSTADGAVVSVPAETTEGGGFRARLPLSGLKGDWRLSLRLGEGRTSWSLPVPPDGGLSPARWRRYGLPWYAKEVPGDGEAFVLRVARVDPGAGLRRRLKR
ncbi:glycosyltransferase family 2 protein [Streptomyces sp. JJ36]|uniref:glycosyltransferase family 2 protein n=1 Tax=Streptomyces sp. JJ36 TaxID=2736645 RepID=UPI001F1E1875|nr:glycosyltransferase family 2 protein [Streptomyces sp. JJ36]MCF6524449.1 glycosyltransferase family 2 protein [Streptomyces sp. JJ36]